VARAVGVGFLLVVVSLLFASRHHFWSRAEAISSDRRTLTVLPHGRASDWSQSAVTIASLHGPVYCISSQEGGRRARVVWGSPRQAEDFDVYSGARTPAPLAEPTFRVGCPQLSPDGQRLLFSAYDDKGVAQIRLSDSPRGEPSSVVTSGYEPTWMANGQEFAYSIDRAHVAVFSLPTMSFTLLADDRAEIGEKAVAERAVNGKGDAIALLRVDGQANHIISIYSSPGFQLLRNLKMPSARRLYFDRLTDDLLVSYQEASSLSTLVDLNWRTSDAMNLGFVPGFDVTLVSSVGQGRIVVARREMRDVWLHDGLTSRQLTSDGENVTAAVSESGDVLIGKRAGDGRFMIWAFDRGGSGKAVTPGPLDVAPSFAPDGARWTYVDYRRSRVMTCTTRTGACEVAHEDQMLPSGPTFSPDGKAIAYVTQLNTPRLVIISPGRAARELGPAFPDCPPVWSATNRIWIHEGSGRGSYWAERDTDSGAGTGNRLAFPNDVDPGTCWWPDAKPGSPFFRRARVERREESRLLRL